MIRNPFLIAGAALALSLAACGRGDDVAGAAPTSRKAASIDAGSPIDAKFKLTDAQPINVERLLSAFPASMRPSYEETSFDEKIGATILTNVRFPRLAIADETLDVDADGVLIERVELYGLDMEAVERLQADVAGDDDEAMVSVLTKARFFGVSGLDPEGAARIGGFEVDKLRLRPGGMRALGDSAADDSAAGDDEDDDAPETYNGGALARLINAFDFGGVYLKDVVVDSGDADDASSVNLEIPDARFVGAAGGRLQAILAKDASFTVKQSSEGASAIAEALGPLGGAVAGGGLANVLAPSEQRTRFASLEWRDIDLSGLLAYGLKDEQPPIDARDLIDLGSMRVRDAESFVGENRLSYAPETVVSAMEFTWLAPSRIRSVSDDVEYDWTAYLPDDETAAREVLERYGLDDFTADSAFEYTWDDKSGEARMETSAVADKFASFAFEAALEGAKLDELEAAYAEGDDDAVASLTAIREASLRIEDESLLSAFYDLSALQAGGEGDDLRKTAPTMLRIFGMQAGAINRRMPSYVDALAGFLADGGAIELNVAPSTPTPLAALADAAEDKPDALLDLLNITVTHEAPEE